MPKNNGNQTLKIIWYVFHVFIFFGGFFFCSAIYWKDLTQEEQRAGILAGIVLTAMPMLLSPTIGDQLGKKFPNSLLFLTLICIAGGATAIIWKR